MNDDASSQIHLSPNLRRFAIASAVLCWTTLALQLLLSINTSLTGGRSALWGVFMYFGYFTILTNIAVAMTLTAAASRASDVVWRFFTRPGVASAIAANIAVVGITYVTVLRQTWNPEGLTLLCDVLLHYAMPVLFIVFWWLAVPARGLRWRDILRWWIYPLAYLVYAIVRGAFAGTYPYPFIDVAVLGYAKTTVNAVFVLLAFTLASAIVIAAGKAKPTP